MNPQTSAANTHGLELGDIYYILFRHKWKIALCSIVGLAAAFWLYKKEAPPYQSEAKLLVLYIISESKTSGPAANNATSKIMPDERGATIMNTEIEILNSMDLARDVAASIGPERILAKAGGGKDLSLATSLIKTNLSVNVVQATSVINVAFRHPDAELVQPVLREVLNRYLKLHAEAHRAGGMLSDGLAQEADTWRSRLALTEDELREATKKANVISLESAKEAYANQLTSIRREIHGNEAELAARVAVFEDLKKRSPVAPAQASKHEPEPELPLSAVEEFKRLSLRIDRLQNREQDLLAQFTAEADLVKQAKAQLSQAESELKQLRDRYPALNRVGTPSASGQLTDTNGVGELASTGTQITALQAKIKELNAQLDKIRAEVAQLDQMEGTILELRRKKEFQEANYRYYAASLEQARINETLGNGKVSNITQIQTPSPPFREKINFKKIGVSAVGGILIGLAWAFLIELYFDRSVRRPIDLQRTLRVPLMLSIPRLQGGTALAAGTTLALPPASDSTPKHHAPVQFSRFGELGPLQAFHETLRDRLIAYFESKHLTHKPKLISVTSLRAQAGVTTTATGLARSLSETGEGNVLLVDMTAGQGSAQQFAKGKPVCGLDELLEARTQAHVQENLYIVSEGNNSDRLSRNLPQRFNKLIPKLKESDFDYIIFDMPCISQLSITPRLAGFMDMVLLVVESEKTDREIVQSACTLLTESKVHVGVVLNKTRNYVPSRLQQQLVAG